MGDVMNKNFEEFYQSYMEHFGANEGDRAKLIEAINTGVYAKANSMMVSAYCMWLDAKGLK
jgi:hypothetical protein